MREGAGPHSAEYGVEVFHHPGSVRSSRGTIGGPLQYSGLGDRVRVRTAEGGESPEERALQNRGCQGGRAQLLLKPSPLLS